MLKTEEKTCILAWKEDGISSEEAAGQAQVVDRTPGGEGQELPQAHHASSQKGLWTSQKDEFDHEDNPEATGPKVSHDDRRRTTDKRCGIAGGLRADHPEDPADQPENA